MPPRRPVQPKAARQATGSTREAMTANVSPSRPGTSRPSAPCLAEPIWPLTASSASPATAAVATTASNTQPRSVTRRPDRRSCSTTGRRSVLRAARMTAASPPRAATEAAAQASGGSVTTVPGRSSTRHSSRVAPQPASVPSGRARASSRTGSASPNATVRRRPYPRSLTRATSVPRASVASVTDRNSSSRHSSSSCAVTSTTGMATDRQLASTDASVPGIALLMITCSLPSSTLLFSAVSAACSRGTPAPLSRALSSSSTTTVPC